MSVSAAIIDAAVYTRDGTAEKTCVNLISLSLETGSGSILPGNITNHVNRAGVNEVTSGQGQLSSPW